MIKFGSIGGGTTRRGFLGGAFAALGTAALPCGAFGAGEDRLLRLGVFSDAHVGLENRPDGAPFDTARNLGNVLRWMDAQGVEAIAFCGDMAHSGLIDEFRKFAAVWKSVFPGDRGGDGRKVEKLLITGNHCIGGWPGRWKDASDAQQRAERFDYGDNPERLWPELFGEPWAPVWHKRVKGLDFVGMHWFYPKPPAAELVRSLKPKLDPTHPFFYLQHAHPTGTCHGSYSTSTDKGFAGAFLKDIPNAVAITGDSHGALTDERFVWQGAYTSISAGCIIEGGGQMEVYANCNAMWHPDWYRRVMKPLDTKDGAGCLIIDVYASHLVCHRWSVVSHLPLGADVVVPIPARSNGPLDFSRRAAAVRPPEFAADAMATAVCLPHGTAHTMGAGCGGKPVVAVRFPAARNVSGSRVFDYVVTVRAEGRQPLVRKILADGFNLPEEFSDLPGECLFAADELPHGVPLAITVVPRNCWEQSGRPLCASVQIR